MKAEPSRQIPLKPTEDVELLNVVISCVSCTVENAITKIFWLNFQWKTET